ncbi:hypothetical protein [Runella sp.]|uniref:hypothetical protein n=1 Tax=Runella sp. TaxID=1960881 RepID=UPI003D0CEB0F
MHLEELIVAWKAQDPSIHKTLKSATLSHFLSQKSEGVLKKIRNQLRIELWLLSVLLLGVDSLFFVVQLPLEFVRISCFTIENLLLLVYIFQYVRVLIHLNKSQMRPTSEHVENVYQRLNHFRSWNAKLSLPIGIFGVVMFAGAQYLVTSLSWLVLEYGFWWWIIVPKMRQRFEDYLAELSLLLADLKVIETEAK